MFHALFRAALAGAIVLSACVIARAQTPIPFVVRDLYTAPASVGGNYNPGPLFEFNGAAYFAADSAANGRELWRTDGTDDGTFLVRDINPGNADSIPSDFFTFLGRLYFIASDGVHGRELWRTDGTPAGTRMVADLYPGPLASNPTNFAIVGNTLYFNAGIGHGDVTYFMFDGESISQLGNIGACCSTSGACTMVLSGSCLQGIWGGFGIPCSPSPCVQPIQVACCRPDGSCLYALAPDCSALGGSSLAANAVCGTTCPGPSVFVCCSSSGTCTTTTITSCILGGGSLRSLSGACDPSPCLSTAQACCLPSGQCFMVGLDPECTSRGGILQPIPHTCTTTGQNATYCTLPSIPCCKNDGTCVVIDPASCRANSGFIRQPDSTCASAACFAAATEYPFVNQTKVYAAGSRALMLKTIGGVPQVWITDGTVAGTHAVAMLSGVLGNPQYWTPFTARNRLYFLLNDVVHGAEMWETDGTAAGTFMVKDIAPGAADGFTGSPLGLLQFVDSAGLLYFIASESGTGALWRTDDTEAGTINLTPSSLHITEPYDLTPVPGGLLFSARPNSSSSRSWWFTDGTPAGTHIVGPTGAVTGMSRNSFSNHIIRANSVLYNDNGTFGELWSTDLTTGTTARVFPLIIDAAHPDPRMWQGLHPTNFSTFAGRVYFSGDHQQPPTMLGNVLWTTDGTTDGTAVALHIDGGSPATWGELVAGAGAELFFSAPDAGVGYELFRTDGTPGGTSLVKDLNPGAASSSPSKLVYRNGLLMFAATVPGATQIVCRSDGTPDGTFPLGSLVAGESSGSQAGRFTVLGNQVLYFETTPATGLELWHTDGTAQNTGLVADIVPGPGNGCSGNVRPVVYNGALYFAGTNGLYRSDGTAAGTIRILATSGGTVGALQPSPIGLFFVGQDNRLWITDGSAAGTRHVTESTSPFSVDALTPVGSMLYFTGQDSTHGRELWRTDGSAAGTQLVADLVAGTTGSFPSALTVYNGALYFLSQGALYTTDGSAAGTHTVLAPGVFTQLPVNLALCGSTLIISGSITPNGRSDLWACDPVAGTVTLLTTAASGYTIQNLVPAGSYLYFSRMQSSNFQSLNRTDGTPGGTIQIAPGEGWVQSSSPGNFVAVGNDIYFSAIRTDVGLETFHTAAPSTSVQLLADVYPGGTGSSPSTVTPFGSSLLFTALTQQHGNQVYISDGTPAGTRVIKLVNAAPPAVSPGIIMAAGDHFFYTPTYNASLACSDGTPDNTYWLADFNMFSGTAPLKGCEMGGKLYFNGKITNYGVELCVSDGTLEGTHMVADLAPGASDSGPDSIAAIGNRVFFSGANTPDGSGFDGPEPCVSDGSAAGTRRAARISANQGGSSYPSNFTDLNGLAIFVATNGGYGTELYRSDGTPAGTYLLKDILPGGESYPRELAAAGNYVFFSADDGVHGRELWRTDGTPAGTVMVKDICNGELASSPTNITAAGSRVYFTAHTPETGVELWTSDGSAAGTFMLFEIVPGPSSANIRSLTRAGDRLYFIATVPHFQPSLWSFDWYAGLTARFLCPADYDRSGDAAVLDIFTFLNEWFIGASRADINGNGTLEVQDIFDFINIWLAGC